MLLFCTGGIGDVSLGGPFLVPDCDLQHPLRSPRPFLDIIICRAPSKTVKRSDAPKNTLKERARGHLPVLWLQERTERDAKPGSRQRSRCWYKQQSEPEGSAKPHPLPRLDSCARNTRRASPTATCVSMLGPRDETAGADIGLHGQRPALQVICLGNSGGPIEENVTAFLVRSTESAWARGSLLAVDAGSHMGPIVRILERDFPRISADRSRKASNGSHLSNGARLPQASPSPSLSSDEEEPYRPEPVVLKSGPFAGLKFPHESARANALHVLKNFISTYLITHPHLDHISGFTINTAGFHASTRPKTLAALPSTVDAIKQHVFNDVIWPNLTDEDGGVGFVTFQRLKEGGDAMLGEGEGRGYIDVCDGLGVRAFKVSHGCCTKSASSHQPRGSTAGLPDSQGGANGEQVLSLARSTSISHQFSAPGTPGMTPRHSFPIPNITHPSPRTTAADQQVHCVVDSTAYFIRDCETQREVLIFGDVEPDSISSHPRNLMVWQEAARKIAYGFLGGIFIESSYDDSQADPFLFGHLNPKHLIAELKTLAELVTELKALRHAERCAKKRKRSIANGLEYAAKQEHKRNRSTAARLPFSQETRRSSATDHNSMNDGAVLSPRSEMPPLLSSTTLHQPLPTSMDPGPPEPRPIDTPFLPTTLSDPRPATLPLAGIKVVIIHIKDTLRDGPHVSENILTQLHEHAARLREQGEGLGCEFIIAASGESYWF
nr:3',5'-cyclic-nucleotide phosphodiesterase [Quercus suber]